MRQRNDTGQALYVQRADEPFWVGPGDTVEWDSPIIGLTVLDEDEGQAPADTKTTKKAAKTEEPS